MGQFRNVAEAVSPIHLIRDPDWEVQRSFDFQVHIHGIEGQEVITLSLESGFTPSESNSPIEMAYGNSKVKVAGQADYSDGSIVIRDFITRDTELLIYRWRSQVWNPETDQIGWAVQYKKEAEIWLLSPDGLSKRVWNLKGVWPSSVEYGDLSYDGGDKKTISVTLSYDRAIRDPNYSSSGSGMDVGPGMGLGAQVGIPRPDTFSVGTPFYSGGGVGSGAI